MPMGPQPRVEYQPFNPSPTGVPDVESPRRDEFTVHANPEDFGGQIGGALQGAGKEIQQSGGQIEENQIQLARVATEANVNDNYANKYAPAVANLRQNFDMLRGQDKVAGYDDYIKGISDLNTQFVSTYDNNPYGKQLMGSLVDRHIAGEIDGAKRELVESQKQFSDQATYDLIKSNNNYAATNYNNVPLVNEVMARNDSHVLIQAINNGHDPNDPFDYAKIEEQQKQYKGDMADAMINRATAAGDVATANNIRADMTPFIPGYKQLAIDNFLHTENMRQTGTQGSMAMINGQPMPQAVGAPPTQVQAMVANTAQTSGVDPNNALAVLRIESSNGQNLGVRGTIGQDKASAGQPLDVQAKALCDNLKIANDAATKVLGRPAEGWEGYALYQQGATGGGALLKADPNAKAVNVLADVYGNPQKALDAVAQNGGNATQTVSDFLGHIQQLYNDNAARANCDFGNAQFNPTVQPFEKGNIDLTNRPIVKNEDGTISTVRSISIEEDGKEVLIPTVSPDGKILSNDDAVKLYHDTGQNLGKFNSVEDANKYAQDLHNYQAKLYAPGDAIMAPHQETGSTVQPGASPVAALRNFESKAPDILARINAIPNVDVRNGVMAAYNKDHQKYKDASDAYSNVLVSQATQLAVNPKFTSMDQVPPDMASALSLDHPQTLAYMERQAEYNANHAAGVVSKDDKEYGSGVKGVLQNIWDGKITKEDQLHDSVAKGDLTIAGYNEMKKQLIQPKEDAAKKASELAMQKAAFTAIETQITHGMKDNPRAQQQWASTLPALYAAIDERNSRKIPPGQYYDPNNKEFIGNDVKALQLPKGQAVGAQIDANKKQVKERTLGDIIGEAQATTDPAKQAALRQEAIDRGFYNPSAPPVPVGQ